MFRISAVILFCLGPVASFAQYSFNVALDPVTEDFVGFAGDGFNPTPSAGQLDSDTWRVIGMSDGDTSFGGIFDSVDFARGVDPDGATTGGVYAFDVGGGNIALGVQPGGSDFTPGSFDSVISNNSGLVVTSIDLSYKVYVYNDQGRANSLNFSFSVDGGSNFTGVPSLDFTSAEIAANTPAWTSVDRSATLSGLTVANGGDVIFRWTGDDVSGSGSRDQFGLDDLSATPFVSANVIPEPSTYGFVIGAFGLLLFIIRRMYSVGG